MSLIRQVTPQDEALEEEWVREIAEPRLRDLHGVDATKLRTGPWYWNVTVSVMEFIRGNDLELELRRRIMSALRAVPGVTEVAEDDRERWVLQGQPTGRALVEAVADVVDDLAPQTSVAYDE